MSEAMTELKKELNTSLTVLQKLRDEVGAKLHLAGIDAKASWKELEVQILAAEKSAATAATEATRSAVNETIKKLETFRASLH